jgi:gluconolactonase
VLADKYDTGPTAFSTSPTLFPAARRGSCLIAELTDGIALSPDGKYLYLTTHGQKKFVMRYDAHDEKTASKGEVFFDMSNVPGMDTLGGIKSDQQGKLYVAGPGGLWILSAAGKHPGTILAGKKPRNFAWGDDDSQTLYLTSTNGLYCIRLGIPGVRPEGNQP